MGDYQIFQTHGGDHHVASSVSLDCVAILSSAFSSFFLTRRAVMMKYQVAEEVNASALEVVNDSALLTHRWRTRNENTDSEAYVKPEVWHSGIG